MENKHYEYRGTYIDEQPDGTFLVTFRVTRENSECSFEPIQCQTLEEAKERVDEHYKTFDKETVYLSACDVIDGYAKRMKERAKAAFERNAVDIEDRNPYYIGLANDIAAACLRWALMDLKPFVDDKEKAIALSEAIYHGFQNVPLDFEDLKFFGKR